MSRPYEESRRVNKNPLTYRAGFVFEASKFTARSKAGRQVRLRG